MKKVLFPTVFLALFLCLADVATAATLYWDGTTSSDWNDVRNWETEADFSAGDPVAPPQNGDSVVIYSRERNPDIPGGGTNALASIVFDNVTQRFGGSSSTITVDCVGALNMQAGGTITVSDNCIGGGIDITIGGVGIAGAGALNFVNANSALSAGLPLNVSCPVTASGLITITMGAESLSGGFIFSDSINDNGNGVTINGDASGRAEFCGNNSNLTGPVTLSTGTLLTRDFATAIGTGVNTLTLGNNAVLHLTALMDAAAWTHDVSITGDAAIRSSGGFTIDRPVVFNSGSTLTFALDNAITGTVSSIISDGANTGNITRSRLPPAGSFCQRQTHMTG